MDLQNFTIQVPEAKRKRMTYPTQKPSLYPVALVVGQFAEYHRKYSPLELQCYPINTALTNPDDLMKRLLEEKMRKEVASAQKAADEEAAAKSGSSESSGSSDESNDSDGDEEGEEEDESVVRTIVDPLFLFGRGLLIRFSFISLSRTRTQARRVIATCTMTTCAVCVPSRSSPVPTIFRNCLSSVQSV